jgi:hypothetical protein
MGEAARARAQRLFTWPHAVARMTEVMTAVIQNTRATRDSLSPASVARGRESAVEAS